jgi:hypothetical protein
MYLTGSEISCGVSELKDVGTNPTKKRYRLAFNDWNDYRCAFILASVPSEWKKSVKFLKCMGFKASRKAINPNSSNTIQVFIKVVSKKEGKMYKKWSAGNF